MFGERDVYSLTHAHSPYYEDGPDGQEESRWTDDRRQEAGGQSAGWQRAGQESKGRQADHEDLRPVAEPAPLPRDARGRGGLLRRVRRSLGSLPGDEESAGGDRPDRHDRA